MLLFRPIPVLVALFAGPCDSQPITRGAGSSSGSQTVSDAGVSSHDEVVHALEKVTAPGASTPPAKKPGKLKNPSGQTNAEGGGRTEPSSSKPKQVEGLHIGESCDYSNECASGWCDSGVCKLEYNHGLAGGEKCSHDSECASGHCTVDGGCE
jgi:hypothetical protein